MHMDGSGEITNPRSAHLYSVVAKHADGDGSPSLYETNGKFLVHASCRWCLMRSNAPDPAAMHPEHRSKITNTRTEDFFRISLGATRARSSIG